MSFIGNAGLSSSLTGQTCSTSLVGFMVTMTEAQDNYQGLGYRGNTVTPICKWHCTKTTFKKWSWWADSYEDNNNIHTFCYVSLLPLALYVWFLCIIRVLGLWVLVYLLFGKCLGGEGSTVAELVHSVVNPMLVAMIAAVERWGQLEEYIKRIRSQEMVRKE